MDIGTVFKHYRRKDIQNEIVHCALDKEAVGSFKGESYAKRPDVLQYPNDIIELVKQGVTSFHFSEETWRNPLSLEPTLKRKDIDELRNGWDLILDIDCPLLEYSKFAGYLLVEALKHHGIKSLCVKFSGNHGFHIAVPFEAFPNMVNGKETRLLFPEAPRAVAGYLKEMIRKHLARMLLENGINNMVKKTGKKLQELMTKDVFDPYAVLSIDTILISSRHLCRMPYSFNEKSGLVSIPIDIDSILNFDKESARPEKVEVKYKFLDRNVIQGEAKQLITQALDFHVKQEEVKIEHTKEFDIPETAIPQKFFPPCIQLILNGLKDGKKRSLFILVNFLSSCGWGYDDMKVLLNEWNKRNDEELKEVYLVGQIRYHKQQKKRVLPPNCANGMYYKDLQICKPDNLCGKVKNPVNYAKKKAWLHNNANKKESRKLSDEEKDRRKKVREERKRFREEVKQKKEKGLM